MTMLTYEEVLADLTAIVEEVGPDFVYEPILLTYFDDGDPSDDGSCVYVDPASGAPSCGVGRWGARRGVNPQSIFDLGINEQTGVDSYLDQLHHEVNALPEVEDRARLLLFRFQQLQDMRRPYGDALNQAQVEATSGEYVVVTNVDPNGRAWHNCMRSEYAGVTS